MTPLIGPVEAPALHAMTFNIRRRMRVTTPADRWARRHPLVRRLVAAEKPALLAAQEVLPDQAVALASALGSSYRRLGHGRLPGPRDESCPLFYDSDRLELLDWSQWALSDRPNQPGSISWGNLIPRVLVEARLRDRATGVSFVAIGTHLDAFSARSRLRSAVAIRERVRELGLPTIVLGDMNAGADSPPLKALRSGDTLRDAWHVAEERLTEEWGTFGGYRLPRADGERIDAILVSPGIRVESIGIHTAPLDGAWPSDHFPVQAVVHLGPAA
jgi:endonuclease/exonuclease/phosphatase family metal-dependent hydrolase